MSVSIPAPTQEIIRRLAAVAAACHAPRLDRAAAEVAIQEHLRLLGIESLPVEWVSDAEEVYEPLLPARAPVIHPVWNASWSSREDTPWSQTRRLAEMAAGRAVTRTAWRAAWGAARAAARKRFGGDPPTWEKADAALLSTIEAAVRGTAWRVETKATPPRERITRALLAFVDALEAGLWLFWVSPRTFVAVPRPALRTEDRLLHCADGPAVWWPDGPRYFFWREVQVPEKVIIRPRDLTALEVTEERNAEVRRVMLERYGTARYLQDIGAWMIHADNTGELYRSEMIGDEPLCMVRVMDMTPQPDGSTRAYWLRVPPNVQTAREAVAWTFGLSPEEYQPVTET